MESKDELIG